jgi:two-component system cell cycle sensor histidine kinase/response regulator CckA
MARQTILLVDDEPPIRELAADVLREEGYVVLEAQNGLEAVRYIERHGLPAGDLSLVLLDMMLPILDGLGVLQHVSAQRGGLPVIAMSASAQHLAEAEAAGARATLAKPFDLDALLEIVGTVARS